jgi:phosphate transport system protein
MTQGEHTVSSFDTELSQLERRVLEMGGLAEAQLAAAFAALQKRDTDGAEKVIAQDPQLDEVERRIETSALSILARRQPMASDLRYVFGNVKIAGSLERIGDYAKNLAKRTLVLCKYPAVSLPPEFAPLATHTIALVREVMDSFTTRDARKAEGVWRRDQEIDDLANRMQQGVIYRMSKNLTDGGTSDATEVECSTHFLFIAKNLERVGDHATNIAEVILYQLSGQWVKEARPKGGDNASVAAAR